jgi:hypothetical protein
MGGKGRRRREKNYAAAHGGNERLPPPPKVKEMEALPSKLRLLMKFRNPSSDKTPGRFSFLFSLFVVYYVQYRIVILISGLARPLLTFGVLM